MTLIITAANSKCLFQVADTRLTSNGSLYDDVSVKQTQVLGNNFCFLISYTGRAYLGKEKIQDWLTNELSSFKIENKKSEEIINFLLVKLKNDYKYNETLILVGIGWVNSDGSTSRIYFNISNAQSSDFSLNTILIGQDIFLKEDGFLPAISNDYFKKRKKKLQKIINKDKVRDTALITSKLVDLIRLGASHKVHGKYIGKHVTSIFLKVNDFSPIAGYHSIEKTERYLPNSVSNQMAIKGIRVTEGGQLDPFYKINPKVE